MKTLLLAPVLLAAPAWAQTSVPPTPASAATFDWKLRLTKGQSWTQTFDVRGVMEPGPKKFDAKYKVRQTLVLHDEVLFANPRFLILRATFSRFEEETSLSAGGRNFPMPDRSKFTRAFIGVPFKIKQAVDGRVLEVSGLEPLLVRGRQFLLALAKSKSERQKLLVFLPNVSKMRAKVVSCQSFALPLGPLSVGGSSSYAVEFYPSQLLEHPVPINRTLRFYDGKTARFDLTRPLVPDRPKADGFFQSRASAISGHTTVDAATGFPQIDLSIRLDGVDHTVGSNGKVVDYLSQEQTQITLTTKLDA